MDSPTATFFTLTLCSLSCRQACSDLVEGPFTPIPADLVIYYLRFTIDYCSASSVISVAEQRTPSHGDLF